MLEWVEFYHCGLHLGLKKIFFNKNGSSSRNGSFRINFFVLIIGENDNFLYPILLKIYT